ncbi:hypothetical protein HYV21_00380 [Candidatus Microgenomates bacterium]|nr:hypothetical protein [Candidatus Microgenomates bacterium]
MHKGHASLRKQNGFAPILAIILLAVAVVGGYFLYQQQIKPNQTACTQEAKICPDGSAVGRVGPNCEFAECPTPQTPQPSPNKSPTVCIQVITPAKNQQTGECKEFPTPCDVPTGWQTIQSCNSTPTACPTPPQCEGNLIYGDPQPDDPNQCPRYNCLP